MNTQQVKVDDNDAQLDVRGCGSAVYDAVSLSLS